MIAFYEKDSGDAVEKLTGWLVGLDFWGLWLPGMVFVLFQGLLVIVVSGGQTIPSFDGFEWLLPFFVLSYITGCLMQAVSLVLPAGLHKLWYSEEALSESNHVFSDKGEIEHHRAIKNQLLPQVTNDKTVLNYYEAALAKAHPVVYSRTVDLLCSASLERQLTIVYGFAILEICLLLIFPGIVSCIGDWLSISIAFSGNASYSLRVLGIVMALFLSLSFLRSHWLYSYRVRFIFRSVASNVDDIQKCLFQ